MPVIRLALAQMNAVVGGFAQNVETLSRFRNQAAGVGADVPRGPGGASGAGAVRAEDGGGAGVGAAEPRASDAAAAGVAATVGEFAPSAAASRS